jgi:hypothetical protein
MKFNSIFAILGLAVVIQAKAQVELDSEHTLIISSKYPEDLSRAATILNNVGKNYGLKEYKTQFNPDTQEVKIEISKIDHKSEANADALISALKTEFGNSVTIEKVSPSNISKGTQDNIIE